MGEILKIEIDHSKKEFFEILGFRKYDILEGLYDNRLEVSDVESSVAYLITKSGRFKYKKDNVFEKLSQNKYKFIRLSEKIEVIKNIEGVDLKYLLKDRNIPIKERDFEKIISFLEYDMELCLDPKKNTYYLFVFELPIEFKPRPTCGGEYEKLLDSKFIKVDKESKDEESFSYIKNKPTKLSDFTEVEKEQINEDDFLLLI